VVGLGRGLSLCFGLLALGSRFGLLALLDLGLGLLDTRRLRDGREDGLLEIVEQRDALGNRERGEAEGVADVHPGDVHVEVLGHLHRQRLDVELVGDLREDATGL